ncbi:ATP-binding protein [uncultured Limosilactobacillus sp.]|uniref:ATP-binding protein n=1 Tax=uncultured Limosilactobacillus sp. TaxID=2837629 RepID=UPI0025ED6F1C|nr:ATP-binding protein [uncultured Limosilactobacillus sp.]
MIGHGIIWPDIPRVVTGVAEWLACLEIILLLNHRRPQILKGIILCGCLVGQVLLQLWCGTWPLTLWIPGILVNILWMLYTIWLIVPEARLRLLIYSVCRAFVLAELWASLAWLLNCWLIFPLNLRLRYQLSFVLVVYLLLFAAFCYLQRAFALRNISRREAVTAGLTAMMIFAISNVGFISSATQSFFGGSPEVFTARVIVDLCGTLILIIQDNYHAVSQLQNDLQAMDSMMQSQYQQYQEYKQSSELVNQHFHDLKHQLLTLALEDDSQKRRQYLNEINTDINLYNVGVKTGNKIADVILTRKNAYCRQHQITFTCIANGSLLNMINTMDLCSLLGNSLDNAIESVEQLTDPDKRLINLRIVNKGQLVVYQVENYTDNPANFADLPQTTKNDKQRHGFGLRSIRRIAEKYGGTMTVANNNHWFRLTVLFDQQTKTSTK